MSKEQNPYKIPESWAISSVKELGTIRTGKKDANHGSENGEYNFFTCASVPIKSETYSFEGESIILPGNGANVGMSIFYNGKFEAYQRTYVINEIKIDSNFLYFYFLGNWKEYNEDKQFGSATNFIKLGNVQNFEIPLPPLAEQKRIVEKLEECFQLVENIERTLEKVENELDKKALSILNNSFNIFLEEKEIKKENIFKFNEIITFQGGQQPSKSFFSNIKKEGYVRLVQIRDFKNDDFLTFIPKEKARRFFNENDVMIGRYGPPVFQILRGLSGAYNVALMKAIPIKEKLDNDYLFYLLQNPFVQKIIIKDSQRSAGQTGIRKELLESFLIELPSLNQQQQIVENIKKQLYKNEKIKKEINITKETIKFLKKSLFQQAFSGQLVPQITKEGTGQDLLEQILLQK